MDTGPNDRRLSAYHIRKACEDSLRRLQTDHIDLYQMHHIDRRTPWEEIWQAMELLVQQGKVIYVGSSNFAGWDIATAQSAATGRHFMGLVSEQSLYNLNARTIELEVIPLVFIMAWESSPGVPSAVGCWAESCARLLKAVGLSLEFRIRLSSIARSLRPMKVYATRLVNTLPTLLSRGCCTTRPSQLRSSGRAPSSN